MKIGRGRILANGLACRCPGCGGRTLFEKGRLLKVNASCPVCGLRIERGDGEFLGPLVINYGLTAFGIVVLQIDDDVVLVVQPGGVEDAAHLLHGLDHAGRADRVGMDCERVESRARPARKQLADVGLGAKCRRP